MRQAGAGTGALAGRLAEWIVEVGRRPVPEEAAAMAERLRVDVAGLCVAARREPYVRAVLASAGGMARAWRSATPAGSTPMTRRS